MKSFVEKFKHKTKLVQFAQIGISENKQLRCLLSSLNNQSLEVEWQSSHMDLIMNGHASHIIAIDYRYIWRTVLFVPLHYSKQMCYRQVITILEQNIPLSLNDILFDYHICELPEQQAQRIAIFALRKQYAQPFLNNKNKVIIDCELHCFARGIHYLSQSHLSEFSDHFYKFKQIYFQFKQDDLLIQTTKPHSNILSAEQFQFDQQIQEPELYLCALGASLWNGKA
ncbi:hypothetical protein BMT54_11830 [Pasteurellaceae bacterium 15-036681]|nr:hypothetical protein BMT54_11830 [Pasteurellaceae bacterium 15-036681]